MPEGWCLGGWPGLFPFCLCFTLLFLVLSAVVLDYMAPLFWRRGYRVVGVGGCLDIAATTATTAFLGHFGGRAYGQKHRRLAWYIRRAEHIGTLGI